MPLQLLVRSPCTRPFLRPLTSTIPSYGQELKPREAEVKEQVAELRAEPHPSGCRPPLLAMVPGSTGRCSLSESSGSTAHAQVKVLHCYHSRSLSSNKELTFLEHCRLTFNVLRVCSHVCCSQFDRYGIRGSERRSIAQVTQLLGGRAGS